MIGAFLYRKIFPGLELVDRELPCGVKLPSTLWAFIWFFVRQVKIPVFVFFFCGMLANICLALEPWFFGQITSQLAKSVSDIEFPLWPFISVCFGYIVFVQIGARFLFSFIGYLAAHYMMPFVMMIRRQLGQYMFGHSYRYFQDDYVGSLAEKVMEMPDSIRLIIFNLGHLQYCLLQIVMALFFYAFLGADFVLLLSAYVAGSAWVVWWSVRYIGAASYTAVEDMNVVRGRYIDCLSNMFLVKVFARRKQEDILLRGNLRQAGLTAQTKNKLVWRQESFQHICNALFQIGLLFLVILRYRDGSVVISDIVMVLTFGVVITATSWWLTQLLMEFIQLLEEIRNSIDTIVQNFEVMDKPDAPVLRVGTPDISISDLVFSYPSRPVFNGLSLKIKAGEKVGFVGPSGAGKSTLVQLILRLYDLESGNIMISGQDISNVTQDSLRENIGVIPQSSELLHRSILENIRFGSENTSLDDVVRAAKLAHADEFIVGLVDKDGRTGYNAEVGERGVKLSGGQRQRIALARAILKNAPILILDEATSALDSQSEKLIEESLKTVMLGRTVLAIAHRLSTLQSMDRLIVMDQGKIVESGTHDELLAQGGLYARLWSLQTSGFVGTVKVL
jgi:ATP-binding cassette subfamily B multidrug efflux pump